MIQYEVRNMGLEELNAEIGKTREIHDQLKEEIEKEKPDRKRIKTILLEIKNPYGKIRHRISNINEDMNKVIGGAEDIIKMHPGHTDEQVRVSLGDFVSTSDSFIMSLEREIQPALPQPPQQIISDLLKSLSLITEELIQNKKLDQLDKKLDEVIVLLKR